MCHQTVRPTVPGQRRPSEDPTAAPVQTDTGLDVPTQEEDHNQDNDVSQETRSEAVTPHPTEHEEEKESLGQADCRTNKQPTDTLGEVQGLCLSSTVDFVGFASPVSSCPAGHLFSSQVHYQDEEDGKDSALPPSPSTVNENSQSETNEAEFKVTGGPQSDCGGHGSCVGTHKSWNQSDGLESDNTTKNVQASGVSLADCQTSVKSREENFESVDDSHTYSGSYSGLDLNGSEMVKHCPSGPPKTE